MRTRKTWTKEEENKISELLSDGQHTFKQIAEIFKVTVPSISFRAKVLGLKNSRRRNTKYSYNRTFFDKMRPQSCYWAGILNTDGCLHFHKKTNYPSISWAISSKDEDHIKRFISEIESNHPYSRKPQNSPFNKKPIEDRNDILTLRLESPFEWIAALEKYGFVQGKTRRSPRLQSDILLHKLSLACGLIDGDGYIYRATDKRGIYIGLCGINKELLEWLKDIYEAFNIPTLSNRGLPQLDLIRDGNLYRWSVGGLSGAIFFHILRSIPVPKMSRKWDNPEILECLEYWKSRTDVWPPQSYFEEINKKIFTDSTELPKNS